ncbi:hypothetical protein ACTD5D_41115 [Nocardia takedensis]|uniref:hypothetical protein n=1 Tax=Nocardia takedensis TaxID=259390 RepID=UPI003F774583
MTIIGPRLGSPAWYAERQRAQNALWQRQDALNVALALEPDPQRQHEILAALDDTYEEVAARGWQTDWERRGSAVPDTVFADAPVPEHLQFRSHPLAPQSRLQENQDQVELELELQ